MTKKKKPARWAYLDELDGLAVDDTPIRTHRRRSHAWEIFLYAAAGMLWLAAVVLGAMGKYGSVGLTVLGCHALCLRWAVYELLRRKRCKGTVLGRVESFTRRRVTRKNARYPVVRFEVNGAIYFAYGYKPTHPSTLGNEEWTCYNPQNPADNFLSSDARSKLSLGLTLATAFLGVAFFIMELN